HRRDDRYWKIGITLPNIDIAHDQLSRAGVAVSDPVQFGDIGYMCHLNDPEDFPIELLQHRFLGHRRDRDGNPDMPLGGGARLGQITLRVTDLPGAIAFYRDRLGMKLLSVQPVPDFDFVLYFLAFTDENPPVTDLEAVENREWLWQRPYTTLELQHFEQKKSGFALPDDGCPGFDSLLVTGAGHSTTCLWDEAGGTVYVAP
ncbi:MAG: VOC family protein, partial [Geminicoccaceae bacterium]